MSAFDGVSPEQYILQSIATFRTGYQPWAQRMRRMYDMVQPRATGGYAGAQYGGTVQSILESQKAHVTEYVSSRIALIHQNFVGRATRFPPQVNVSVLEDDANQAQRQQWLINFFGGILYLLDHRVSLSGRGTSWMRRVVDMASCPGKMVGSVHVRETHPGSGDATVDVDLYDPLTCYHDFETFPRRVVRDYVTNAGQVRYGLQLAGKAEPSQIVNLAEDAPVAVSEFWMEEPRDRDPNDLRVFRAVVLNGSMEDDRKAGLAMDPWESGFDHIPIITQSTHATTSTWRMPQTVMSTMSQTPYMRGITWDELLYHSQPYFASLEQTHYQFQQFMSLLFEGLAETLHPMKVFKSDDGLFHLMPEQTGPGAATSTSNNNGESIEYVVNQAMQAAESNAKMAIAAFDADFNRLANPSLFGDTTAGDSGYLQTIKAGHALAIFEEPIRGASRFGTNVLMEAAHQFQRSGLKWSLKGFNNKGFNGRFYFEDDFEAADCPKQYIMALEVKADLPTDDQAKLQYAIQGTANGLFSVKEARSEVLDIQDPDRTQRLIDAEREASLPVVKSIKVLRKARAEIKALFEKAHRIGDAAARDEALEEAHIAQAQYEQLERQTLGQVQNAGQQPEPGNPSPEAMPPEMGVGTNPDRNAQAMGLVSSNLGGQGSVGAKAPGG